MNQLILLFSAAACNGRFFFLCVGVCAKACVHTGNRMFVQCNEVQFLTKNFLRCQCRINRKSFRAETCSSEVGRGTEQFQACDFDFESK